jgi:hypothetical protein
VVKKHTVRQTVHDTFAELDLRRTCSRWRIAELANGQPIACLQATYVGSGDSQAIAVHIMNPMTNWSSSQARSAPWYGVPSNTLVSIEHPCVVKDPDKAIETLGGTTEISKASYSHPEMQLCRLPTRVVPGDRPARDAPVSKNNIRGWKLHLVLTYPSSFLTSKTKVPRQG